MKRQRSLTTRVWQHLVTFKLTPPGRSLVMMIFASSIGAITVEIPIYQIFCCQLAFLGIVEFLGMVTRPRMSIDGWLPAQATAGEPAQGQVVIRNNGYWPAFDIMGGFFTLPPELKHIDADLVVPSIPSGQSVSVPVTLLPERRGVYPLPDYRAHSTFPLNLMRFGSANLSSKAITVLPAFHPLESFEAPVSQRFQSGEILLENRRGQSPEYFGNRDYIPGEPIRRLDFRAWARLGRPVVREYQEERCSRVAILLDTQAPARKRRADDIKAFEAAVSLTAAIAQILHDDSTIIDVFSAGPELYIFEAAPGTTHFEHVLEILASVEQSYTNPLEKLAPVVLESLESISLVVSVLLDWDDSREELSERIVAAGCALRTVLVRTGSPTRIPDKQLEGLTQVTPDEVLSGKVRSL